MEGGPRQLVKSVYDWSTRASKGHPRETILALVRSQTGSADRYLSAWTLVASMLKYSEISSMFPGRAEWRLRVGYVGAARARDARVGTNRVAERMLDVFVDGG